MAHKSVLVVPAVVLVAVALWAFLAAAFPLGLLAAAMGRARDLAAGLFLLALYSLVAAVLIARFVPGWSGMLKALASAGAGAALVLAGVLLSGFKYGEYGGIGLEGRSFLLAPAARMADVADAAAAPQRRHYLLKELGSPDVQRRRGAAAVLETQAAGGRPSEQHPDTRVLVALARGLRDPDAQVRESCASALEQHAPAEPKVLEAILSARDDPDPQIRERAARLATALGR